MRMSRKCNNALVMSRLDRYLEALRFLARSSEPEANRLLVAELRIREFLAPVKSSPAALRTSLDALDDAVIREAELKPQDASFWQGVRHFIASLVGDD